MAKLAGLLSLRKRLASSRKETGANAVFESPGLSGQSGGQGAEQNVEECPGIEGSLPLVIEEGWSVIACLLRHSTGMAVTQFRPVLEFPELSLSGAVLNAIIHQDCSIEGDGSDVRLFEDRRTVLRPGGLVGCLCLEEV